MSHVLVGIVRVGKSRQIRPKQDVSNKFAFLCEVLC